MYFFSIIKYAPDNVSITYYLLNDHSMMQLVRVRGHQFQLPNCIHKFYKQSFILSSLFRFLK